MERGPRVFRVAVAAGVLLVTDVRLWFRRGEVALESEVPELDTGAASPSPSSSSSTVAVLPEAAKLKPAWVWVH